MHRSPRAGRLALPVVAFAPLAFALSAAPVAAQLPEPGTTVVIGATVVDGTGAPPVPDAIVIIEDGRITAVGPQASIAIPDGAEVVDAAGRWLLPGFIDAHAHLTLGPVSVDHSGPVPGLRMTPDPLVPQRTLRTLLAWGVTAMRDPGGNAQGLVALREAVEHGALVGPRMRVAGPVIDQTAFTGLVETVRTAEDVRAAVREHAEAGVDMVKLYTSLGPDLLEAGIDEAHRQGVEAVAHLMFTTWTEAAEFGLDHVLHILPGSPELLPEERRSAFMSEMQRGTQFMYAWFELVDYDSPEIREMIGALADRGVSVDPTLVLFEGMVRGDDPFYTASQDLDYAAPSLVANWRSTFHFNLGWSEEDFARARAAWPRFLELARRLHEGGVMLVAGTDANNPWIVPGVSFHRELELLVEAGVPEHDVLVIATRNGARVLGLEDEIGTVEVGKAADLVLLGGDPLVDISNTRKIVWTMQAGRRFEPEPLLRPLRGTVPALERSEGH